MPMVAVSGSFDDLRSRHIRFLEEASKLGEVHVQLWSDETVAERTGKPPKFPAAERLYFVDAIRYVTKVAVVEESPGSDALLLEPKPAIWAVEQAAENAARRQFAQANRLQYHVITNDQLGGFPLPHFSDAPRAAGTHRVIVTGCYDWVHTGHVRFFEEASEYGELFVSTGHDANIRMLKGEGHPLFPQDERQYIVQSIRFVTRALIATGNGWLDAEPEIERFQPDRYLVNEDGDKPEKRAYCAAHGIEYIVLKREPKPGLTRRQSTALRGF